MESLQISQRAAREIVCEFMFALTTLLWHASIIINQQVIFGQNNHRMYS
jgi:hypothetical protein